jgi:hypothetical protein
MSVNPDDLSDRDYWHHWADKGWEDDNQVKLRAKMTVPSVDEHREPCSILTYRIHRVLDPVFIPGLAAQLMPEEREYLSECAKGAVNASRVLIPRSVCRAVRVAIDATLTPKPTAKVKEKADG